MVDVSYHQSVTNLQALWADSSAPFDRAEWFELLETTQGAQPFYAVAKGENNQVVLPLKHSDGGLTAFTNWYSFHWQPIVNGPETELLMVALCKDLRRRTARLSLAPLPTESAHTGQLRTALKSAGWTVFEETCDTNHILEVNGRTYAQYLAGRPGKLRTTLKRKAKKVEISIADQFDADLWSDYEDIYANSWKPEEGEPAMLRTFAEQEGAAGRIRLAVARHEGNAVAAQFWTVENDTAYIHKLAHRKDATQISPGSSLTAALFEHVIDHDKVALVNFGTGDDPYKADWMESVRPRLRFECFVASKPSNWPGIAKRMVHNLARGSGAS